MSINKQQYKIMDQQFYETRQQNILEYMADCWYNLRYVISKYLNNSESQLQNQQSFNVYILGKSIQVTPETLDERINEIKKLISETIWFTYRKNFPCLLDTSYISDTGWGCMIRAGQMVMAQQIKRHLKSNDDSRDKYLCNITQAFADNDELESKKLQQLMGQMVDSKFPDQKVAFFLSPFSIQKIALLARKEFGVQPGQWYKPNYILFVLETLHNSFPIRGSDNLRMLVFNDSSLFKDQILQKMFDPFECHHNPEVVLSEQQFDLEDRELCPKCIQQIQLEDKHFAVSIFILTRIGLDEPNKDYLAVLDEIMMIPSFQGVVGGSPSRALYILGRVGTDYIYLDPHYVQVRFNGPIFLQEATTRKSIILNDGTFKCDVVQLLPNTNVDTSMGLAFYVRNYEELTTFWADLQKVKDNHKEHFFIYKADKTPVYEDYDTSQLVQPQELNDDVIILE